MPFRTTRCLIEVWSPAGRPGISCLGSSSKRVPCGPARSKGTDTELGNKGFKPVPEKQELSRSGKPIGRTVLPQDDWSVQAPVTDASPGVNTDSYSSDALPKVSRGRVFSACWQTGAVLSALALALRSQAGSISVAILGTDPKAVDDMLHGQPELWHVSIAIAAVAAVTSTRYVTLQLWPAFAQASDRSNQQVLDPLEPWDLLWVACIPGISEELLFRGALIPALYPDWRGVLLSAGIFGALHNSGGRNPAFSVWSGAVGALYGAAYLYTNDLYVPMAAHSMANVASGLLWMKQRRRH